ncbi:MAG: phosphoribosylformimino-5-aminoimidazole carboxamide ribotide isomerase [Lachnospiraceae bacterium]|nr:phosphoribosylformimino-5-aminoimidazole carboxamide ribotide isomerase [Lachnospiraceae bacterium]
MQFRPCIDIHNGAVKQIVGSSLKDAGDMASENFVSGQSGAYFAKMYHDLGLKGGHVILLNHTDSPFYGKTLEQAKKALGAYPGELQAGGGITDENAAMFLEAGASHVIVTSFAFNGGKVHFDRLDALTAVTGRERLVLDLSCKRSGESYYVCTDRWQKMTDLALDEELLKRLSQCCDEFLIHAVDVEGKSKGIEQDVVRILANFCEKNPAFSQKVTYAGGVGSLEDLRLLKKLGMGHVNVTIGSALSIFGGQMELSDVLECINE